MTRSQEISKAVLAVAALLEVPRDRLGRLDPVASDAARDAREAVRLLAVRYAVAAGGDYMSQCAAVLRAALKGGAQ